MTTTSVPLPGPKGARPTGRRALLAQRLGLNIRVKLTLAFGSVLALTLVAGGVGYVSFQVIGGSLRHIVDANLPALTATQELAAASGQIAAAAPSLMSAATPSEGSAEFAALAAKQQAVAAQIKALQDGGAVDPAAIEAIAAIADRVKAELDGLNREVTQKLRSQEQRLDALLRLESAHDGFLKTLAPAIDDGNFSLMTEGDDALKKTDKGLAGLMDGGVATLRSVLEIQVEGTTIVGQLIEAANAPTPDRAALTKDPITAAASAAAKTFKALPDSPDLAALRKAYDAIVALSAAGAGGVYALPFAPPGASLADLEAVQRARAAFVERIHAAHHDFAAKAVNVVDGANFDLVVASENLAKENQGTISQLMERGVTDLRSLLELQAEGNRLAGLIREAATAEQVELLIPARERIDASLGRMKTSLAALSNKDLSYTLGKLVEAFADLARGPDNLLAVRERELRARTAAAASLARNRKLAEEFDAAVVTMMGTVEHDAEAAGARSGSQIESNRVWLIVIMGVSVVFCLLVGWLVVARNIADRIVRLTRSMRDIAHGDLDAKIPLAGRDEITAMAHALEVFRDTAREVTAANERTEAERHRAATARRDEMAALANDFEASVKGVVESLSAAADEMQATAKHMAKNASETSSQSTTVATASGEATSNVQTVATAAEQLSASIAEISRKVNESAQIAERAVGEADRTNVTVKGLASAAQRIGEVVKLINEIANQTNLLALNATIEAARAGEAGKGFAVVATEVKNLAAQTAKATEDIAAQIGAIQTSTAEAVAAIDTIGGTIGQINHIASTIASAVEQQGAATAAIARNVQEAATGTNEVTSHIAGVRQAASETGEAAAFVLTAANDLSRQSDALKSAVARFLASMRAA